MRPIRWFWSCRRPRMKDFSGTPLWLSVSDFLQSHTRLCVVFERFFPTISIQGYLLSGDRLSCECIISCVGWIIAGYDRRRWPRPSLLLPSLYSISPRLRFVAYQVLFIRRSYLRKWMCDHAGTSRSCSCITVACSDDIYCSHSSRLLLSRCGVPRLICSPSLTPCPAFIHFSEIHLYAGLRVTALLETFAQGTPRAKALYLKEFVCRSAVYATAPAALHTHISTLNQASCRQVRFFTGSATQQNRHTPLCNAAKCAADNMGDK